MLNGIHLVQYQHYHAALLKKLAPESYKQVGATTNNASEAFVAGSIDEILQSMDQTYFTLFPSFAPNPGCLSVPHQMLQQISCFLIF
jgi:senataxin